LEERSSGGFALHDRRRPKIRRGSLAVCRQKCDNANEFRRLSAPELRRSIQARPTALTMLRIQPLTIVLAAIKMAV